MRCWPLALLVAVSGCSTSDPAGTATDAWVGRWNGPEGTYLELAGANGSYEVNPTAIAERLTEIGFDA